MFKCSLRFINASLASVHKLCKPCSETHISTTVLTYLTIYIASGGFHGFHGTRLLNGCLRVYLVCTNVTMELHYDPHWRYTEATLKLHSSNNLSAPQSNNWTSTCTVVSNNYNISRATMICGTVVIVTWYSAPSAWMARCRVLSDS